jgi:hypothetical protein
MAADAARRGQGRGHQPSSISWPIDSHRSEIDGRLKQDLAYSPPGTPCGARSISKSGPVVGVGISLTAEVTANGQIQRVFEHHRDIVATLGTTETRRGVWGRVSPCGAFCWRSPSASNSARYSASDRQRPARPSSRTRSITPHSTSSRTRSPAVNSSSNPSRSSAFGIPGSSRSTHLA